MKEYFKDKSILITGGVGSVGTELVKQLLAFETKKIIIIDNNESEIFFATQKYNKYDNVIALVGDITNRNFVMQQVKGVDIVFHTAALKHVILGEYSPESIVSTNIIGIQNILDACLENEVEKFIFTSSDKAVNPTNVMGTSKLMGERLVTAMNNKQKNSKTIFSSTRFGNVIGTKGGVFTIFKNQILKGEDITVTDKRMTRFFMTIEESVSLVLKSCVRAQGGEVFVTKMPVINIYDLAVSMRTIFSKVAGINEEEISIKEIGSKAGEKLYEELMSEEEVNRTIENDDFFIIFPAFKSLYSEIEYSHISKNDSITKAYNSANEKSLSHEEIHNFLKENNLL